VGVPDGKFVGAGVEDGVGLGVDVAGAIYLILPLTLFNGTTTPLAVKTVM
jgi:hypothetical protein